jgi:hypothetical protein
METSKNIYFEAESELLSIGDQILALQKRQNELRQFIDLGKRLFLPSQSVLSAFTYVKPTEKTLIDNVFRTPRENSKKARILNTCMSIIKMSGATPTSSLVTQLEAAGIELTAVDKLTAVSTILSRSDKFKSDRVKGWSLVEKSPHDVDASAGLFTANAVSK